MFLLSNLSSYSDSIQLLLIYQMYFPDDSFETGNIHDLHRLFFIAACDQPFFCMIHVHHMKDTQLSHYLHSVQTLATVRELFLGISLCTLTLSQSFFFVKSECCIK